MDGGGVQRTNIRTGTLETLPDTVESPPTSCVPTHGRPQSIDHVNIISLEVVGSSPMSSATSPIENPAVDIVANTRTHLDSQRIEMPARGRRESSLRSILHAPDSTHNVDTPETDLRRLG